MGRVEKVVAAASMGFGFAAPAMLTLAAEFWPSYKPLFFAISVVAVAICAGALLWAFLHRPKEKPPEISAPSQQPHGPLVTARKLGKGDFADITGAGGLVEADEVGEIKARRINRPNDSSI